MSEEKVGSVYGIHSHSLLTTLTLLLCSFVVIFIYVKLSQETLEPVDGCGLLNSVVEFVMHTV